MIASLGMYDRVETAACNDALWAAIRSNLGYGPAQLDRTSAFMDIWKSPELLFSQTCGMPYRTGLHSHVQLLGTPDYAIPDVPPGYYYSVMLVRAGDDKEVESYCDRVLAYNGPTSQSGWAAAQNHACELGFQFEELFRSGAHMASAVAVADGQADIAALDALTWRMICQYDDIAKNLSVIATTSPTPGLPFITAPARDADAINVAVDLAIQELPDEHREVLGINGMVRFEPADYMQIRTPPAP